MCSGCQKCTCNDEGRWVCQDVSECYGMPREKFNEELIENVIQSYQDERKKKKFEQSYNAKTPFVPRPPNKDDDVLLGLTQNYEMSEDTVRRDLMAAMYGRNKRSVYQSTRKESNDTIRYYHTVDDMNKDTLINNDTFGTIGVNKVHPNLLSLKTRRTGRLDNGNKSNPLQIDYKTPLSDHHIVDNKIDASGLTGYELNQDKIDRVLGNLTRNKDKSLSKIIVNELKKGIEVVGDVNSPAVSNITFRPENDTLVAMAFIAGNLLNKLWNMEKDGNDDTIETDILKHEKIADLLDLFKEPLTLRQETFLKSALEHLSDALDKNKDASNVSLCENVEEVKKEFKTHNDSFKDVSVPKKENCDKAKQSKEKKGTDGSAQAVARITDVLDLIKKYVSVQKHLHVLKHPSDNAQSDSKPILANAALREGFVENGKGASLNLFGDILEKVTNLLLPKHKANKKISQAIRNQNFLKESDDLKSKLKRIYDIDLENATFTVKDKLILDYLSNLRNSDCLMNQGNLTPSNIEGGILLNLSQFFKVKSFVDLLKLLEPEKPYVRSSEPITEILSTRKTTEATKTTETVAETTTTADLSITKAAEKLAKTKENLKIHIKTIINDLLELQNASGMSIKDGNLKIADALPCLYKIMNVPKEPIAELSNGKSTPHSLEIIKNVFDALKSDLKNIPQRRSMNRINRPRPKSAVVWERVFTNIHNTKSTSFRRQLETEQTKSFEELTKMMQICEAPSNVYKYYAMSNNITPANRLTLLKILNADVTNYKTTVEAIIAYLENTANLPLVKMNDINEFIDNAAANIKLDIDVVNNLVQPKRNQEVEILPSSFDIKNNSPFKMEALKDGNEHDNYFNPHLRLSRDDIINQLLKNRVQAYLVAKEAAGLDSSNDMNVRLAKKIMNYIANNNYNLARQLFKVFLKRSQQPNVEDAPRNKFIKLTSTQMMMDKKEPLIHFEGPKTANIQMKSMTEDLIKQLMSIKL